MWADNVSKRINKKNTVIYCVPPDIEPFKDEGYEQDFITYIDKGKEFAPYDLILVDGMARGGCINRSYNMLTENGLLVVHDANREIYRESMKKLPHVVILEDFRRGSGGIAFLSKSLPSSYYYDLNKHIKLWKE